MHSVQSKSNCELSLRLTVSADVAAVRVYSTLFFTLLHSPPSAAIYAALSRYSLVCTTQNYCQVLQVTMTTKATSEWNVAYAARTMTPWLHALTHTHTHTQTNRRKDRRTFITAHNDARQKKMWVGKRRWSSSCRSCTDFCWQWVWKLKASDCSWPRPTVIYMQAWGRRLHRTLSWPAAAASGVESSRLGN